MTTTTYLTEADSSEVWIEYQLTDRKLWSCHGEVITGEDVARRLEATRDLLKEKGWTGVEANCSTEDWWPECTCECEHNKPPVKPEGTNLFEWLSAAWDALMWYFDIDIDCDCCTCPPRKSYREWKAQQPRTLQDALTETGDRAGGEAAKAVITAILKARVRAHSVRASAWEGRTGRTQDEVLAILNEAADLARKYGPKS